jgi:monofunctional biosynthetic peptidoglycan transglycosylase
MWLECIPETERIKLDSIINLLFRFAIRTVIVLFFLVQYVAWASELTWLTLLLRVLGVLYSGIMAIVFLVRWINPPTSAFILQVRAALRAEGKTDRIELVWTEYARLGVPICLAAIAGEDMLFVRHAGFQWGEILRVWNANRHGMPMRGASGITQQMVKNLFLWHERTYTRKILEAFLTALVEACLPKKRILEIYLNIIQFDRCVFGVEAAARHFFKKAVNQLSWEQCALLMTATQNPTLYRLDAPSAFMLSKQSKILHRMQLLGEHHLDRIA